MSLIAWYPLNGNLRNIGTDGEDLTPFEGTPTYVDGKTGKAVYFSSDNVNQRLTRSLFLKQHLILKKTKLQIQMYLLQN